MTPSEFDEHAATAQQLLHEGDPQGAAKQLRLGWQAEGLDQDADRMRTFVRIVRSLGEHMALAELADAAARTLADPEPQALFDLGFQLVDVGLPGPAIPVLRWLDRLAPGSPGVVTELAVAYERTERHSAAQALLLANPTLLQGDFWLRYLLCFNALSAADLPTARSWADRLAPEEGDSHMARAALRMHDMLARSQAAEPLTPLDDRDLRGWHFVMNGSVLLHLSPYGFDEGMRGRYAFTQDSEGAVLRDLRRLQQVLVAADAVPTALLPLPDRSSQIVAHTLSRLLEVPVADLADLAESRPEALVVAYDTDPFDDADLLSAAVAAGCPIVARGARWTGPPALVPRYVGLLFQMLVAPWEERLVLDDDGQSTRQAPSEEPTEVWVQRILDAQISDTADDLDAVLALLALGGSPGDLWYTGPVRSNRFS
ncbi:MAG: hypothetical protein KTR31_08990 [Myxococcales bacterium]|nr:hypothetical protein [Myxococcales bacterium]